MRHHQYNPSFTFVHDPVSFNKHTERRLLQYCLGATLYMPAKKRIEDAIMNRSLPGLTSMVMCCEDAIADTDLPEAESNVIRVLDVWSNALEAGTLCEDDLPLFFLRVRSPEQFKSFTRQLTPPHVRLLTGFVFPKFNTRNGHFYLGHLQLLNDYFHEVLYGMPILESREIAYKETRSHELIGIQNLLKPYRELILNIRVGATDISSQFGVRRGIDYSIYDILMVRDCLSDILNSLSREEDDYVLSAPVWEYFLADKRMKFEEVHDDDIHSSLLKRNLIVNAAIDGLLREVILDKANGFVGKTIIHPSHLKYVNAMQAVTKEEYDDAAQILGTNGGVVKSARANKMNEINPHRHWATKVTQRAKAFGVIGSELDYLRLFRVPEGTLHLQS